MESQDRLKPRPLAPNRQVTATSVNTGMIRKQNSLIAVMEKVLVVWVEDQTSHNIPLKPKPNPEQGPNFL